MARSKGDLLVSKPTLNHTARTGAGFGGTSHNSGALSLIVSSACRSRRQGKMSSRPHRLFGAAAIAALLVLPAQALAQSDDADAEMRIQRLENQLRQLTGQNEELQYRNRQLEERLRQLQGAGVAGAPPAGQPNVAAVPPAQAGPAYGQPPAQGGYPQSQPGDGQPPGYQQPQVGYQQPQIAAPAPIVQEPAAAGGR